MAALLYKWDNSTHLLPAQMSSCCISDVEHVDNCHNIVPPLLHDRSNSKNHSLKPPAESKLHLDDLCHIRRT